MRTLLKQKSPLSFENYMNTVLYHPTLGYYSKFSPKIGKEGDFITAPELTPLFTRTLGKQFKELLNPLKTRQILELGAGTGAFAEDLLQYFSEENFRIDDYFILELSAGLRTQQEARLKSLKAPLQWLNTLPKNLSGLIFGNEVLDAMPVHRFIKRQGQCVEQSVILNDSLELSFGTLPASPQVETQVRSLESRLGKFPEGYCSEINLWIRPFLNSLADSLEKGAILLVDYGYPESVYYQASRRQGTLCCYHKHQMNTDPLLLPGEQDLTAHVNFTEVAEAGLKAGLTLEGYTTQAFFLANLGIENTDQDPETSQKLRRLLHPESMGEIFKVIGFSKNFPETPWKGFQIGDQRFRL